MAAGEGSDQLQLYWEHFFKAETGTYEKSTWLDLFLAEFLVRVNDGADPKELIKFCPVSGVVSLVGCELLCGIHRVTSSLSAHLAPPPGLPAAPALPDLLHDRTDDGEDAKAEDRLGQATSLFTRANAQSATEILKKYLLGGVAWRGLMLLRALGVEGLSCCRQLSSVLVWLFGELGAGAGGGGGAARAGEARLPAPPRTPMHLLFSHKIWAKQKLSGGHQVSKGNSAGSSEKSYSTGRSRHVSQTRTDSSDRVRRKHKPASQSSDSADSNADLQVLTRSLTVKACTPDDFQYFNSPTRSTNEHPNETLYIDAFPSAKKPKPKPDDYMNDKHRDIIHSEITTFEFTLIITDLLQQLCKAESSLSGAEGSQISVQCINFSLRNLCSLQFGSQYDSLEVSRIKLALTELLIVSLDKVLIHSDLCTKLINNGILPMLLRILEDVISKRSSRYQTKEEQNRAKAEPPSKTESENLLKFVFGIGYSITAFFHCLLMQCRSIDKLREFTDQFKLYGECLKGGLLKDCIELMIRIPVDHDDSVIFIKKLIDSIGKLISGMKRVRSEVVHSAACPRTRHKMCRQRVSAGMHHHHDILGEAGTGLPLSSACCISVLYGTLTSLLTDDEMSTHTTLRNKILRVMLQSGVCCCFSPGFLMECVVRLMLTQSSVANLCLQLLEHTVYGDLGASVLVAKVTDQLPCSICEPCDDKRDVVRKYCPHGVSPVERKSVWSFLIHYNSLLQLDNHNNVLHATVSHILRVTPKCRTEMRYELLFSVMYPTFIVAKHRYMIKLEESAYYLTVSCLNIFASLLNTVSFADQFIQKGGLSYVLELVSLPEFSNQCCSILEIAIIVEIFKLLRDDPDMTFFKEIGSLASVQMLFKSLSEMTDKCYTIYRLKLPNEKFRELCDVSKETEALALSPTLTRQLSSPIAMQTSESIVEDSIENYVEVLKNIWTFWKSCAELCLYSPMFRSYVISEEVFVDSYALLKVLLYYVCQCECAPVEMKVAINILEALLTVQFAVSDVTSGRSKETSCAVVRAALGETGDGDAGGEGESEKGREGGTGEEVRALCEALIRVALTVPSPRHSMPRLRHAKVPALWCPSDGSSAEASSSEESAAARAPYASELSDARPSSRALRADLGYEADVDVGKLSPGASQRARRPAASVAAATDVTGRQAPPPGERAPCAAYAAGGALAHPELCAIVVDVLAQLVQRLVSSPASSSLSSAGARLARACCARLAGALARARAAPPQLLRRLLAPAALLAAAGSAAAPHLLDLQRSILQLVHALAAQSIEPSELAAFLQLFSAPAPPLGALLAALQRLVAAATPGTPDCILSFPAELHSADAAAPPAEEYVMVSSASSHSAAAEAAAAALHHAHLRAGIDSAWARAAVRCCMEGAWAPWLQGFALLLWLRTEPPAEPPTRNKACGPPDETDDEWQSEWQDAVGAAPRRAAARGAAHVVSLGHESLMFEVWLDTGNGDLSLRLSRPDARGAAPLSALRVPGALPARRWACVALNVREAVHRRRTHVLVTVYVDGCEFETVSLPLQGILVRKAMPTTVLVGEARSAPVGGVYHLSALHVYRAPALCAARALHLAAHGPDHACHVRCESPNFPLVLTPRVLDFYTDWDQVYEMSGAALRELHEQLLLTFAAHAPHILNLYHGAARAAAPTVFSGGGAGGTGGVPEALPAAWAGAPLRSRHRGLAPALCLLGGPDVLLYLFARTNNKRRLMRSAVPTLFLPRTVVELDGTAEEQATALWILLRACSADNRLYAQLHEQRLDMLLTVLRAPQCRCDQHLLKVILECACSSPVLTVAGDCAVVAARPDTALLEPRLLLLLLRTWRQLDTEQELSWEVVPADGARHACRGSLWALALCCLRALLGDGGEGRALRGEGGEGRAGFNLYQMSRAGVLRALLAACKERFLDSECGPLGACASSTLVQLVRSLLGSPPALERVAQLCDFLLLMHQASDTFVTHSRANFYFLLSAETQESSDFASRPARRRDGSDRASTSSVTSDETADTERLEQSGESTKHMKGVINAQIRDGRKHNISSTSEISDLTAARGEGEGEGAGDPELTDYVVVDEEELAHAAAEPFAGALYHQRRVRAGAAPGWEACEGLLLLLRDCVAALPPPALAQALCGAVQPEWLLVLANHRAAGVRAAVLRCAAALERRAPHDKQLRSHHYYLHLANQISLYPGSWELATACAALLTRCDVPLEDQLDDEVWLDVSEAAAPRAAPLLALLPASLHDAPLAHNIARLVLRLIDKVSLKALTDACVPEAVVRALRGAGRAAREGRSLLLADLQQLLARLAGKALAAPLGAQTLSDLHHLLSYVELSCDSCDACGAGGACDACDGGDCAAGVARDAQLALFIAELDLLEERLHTSYTAHTKYANYFATVLSSAVSLGAEAAERGERGELAARHLGAVCRAAAYLRAPAPPPRRQLAARAVRPLLERLLAALLPAASGAAAARPKWWVGSGADWLSPLQELFWWAASPAPAARALQPALLRALHAAPRAAALLAPSDPPAARKLAVYLLTMLKHIHAAAETGPAPVELGITDWLREWAVATQAGLAARLPSDALRSEAARLLAADEARWARQHRHQRAATAKVVFSKDALTSKLTESAMGITRHVVDAQNGERKAFMEQLRRAHSDAVHAAQRWRRLVDTHTHERAVWHDPLRYPLSWQLDPTEGPARVRVRLRRAHLDIPPRFLKPHARHKAERVRREPPLHGVVGAGAGGGAAARLQLHETVAHMARVTHVTVASEARGELLLSDRCIHFVPEEQEEEPESGGGKKGDARPPPRATAETWPLEAVVQVYARRWCLQERGAELFLSSGHALLLAFADQLERDAFLKALHCCHLPNRIEPDTLQDAMSEWRSGAITNWEYLMRLNGLAGRSYNDLMQYPVLPFVIADYTSRILDLTDPASFRDLAKPIAVQYKDREQHYINTYNDLSVARREGCSPLVARAPHHYASLYSNSGGVLHYLVRLPPFTEQFLNYQDNNFDMPDRTFHSLATTWRLITRDSPTDVKELIPELFYLPELLRNDEGLELGRRQCGAAVDAVELPPWAADARLFTLVQRQALEAPLVRERLPLWLDLVFGWRQTGAAARDALNVFPACTYYGFDPAALPDALERTAAAAMVRTYGQAPRQLLRQPHPRRADALPPAAEQVPVWAGVAGASWGRYCGSPALPPAAVTRSRALPGAAALHALPHARAAAAAPRHTALVPLPPAGTPALPGDGGGGGVALLSWGHSDGALRLKRRSDARPELLLHVPHIDQITVVASCCARPDCASPVLLGMSSGRVLALSLRAHGAPRTRSLHAHGAPVAGLRVCARAKLVASASVDGLLVLWDLNKLSYIRTLPNRGMLPVTHVAISETLSDVASVHDATARRAPSPAPAAADDADSDSYERDDTYKYQSLIRVHTVNGTFVGSVKVSELVTCVCYSNAPEGVSANCVAAGLQCGSVRLYSSWDLRPVAHVPPPARACARPLLSLTYSSDASVLFGCYAGGACVAWESGAPGKPAPRLLAAHQLI